MNLFSNSSSSSSSSSNSSSSNWCVVVCAVRMTTLSSVSMVAWCCTARATTVGLTSHFHSSSAPTEE